MRRSILAAVVTTAMLALAGPSAASTPQRFEFDFQEADSIDCAQFNPAWTFHDDFLDTFEIRGQLWRDANGDPLREIDHVYHVSNDVNSVTGLTLHEHNHYTVTIDFAAGIVTSSGAFNIMQRRGVGEVIHNSGHRVFDFVAGQDLAIRGPQHADDADFCAAVAP